METLKFAITALALILALQTGCATSRAAGYSYEDIPRRDLPMRMPGSWR